MNRPTPAHLPLPPHRHRRRLRRRLTAPVIVTGLVGSLAVALSMGASLSGFAATITNTTNTASSGTMSVTETSGTATCSSSDSTSSCSTINKYGGTTIPLIPGGPSSTVTVAFLAVGSLGVSDSTLTPGTCTATSSGGVGSTTPTSPNTDPGNLCSQLNVKVYKGAVALGTPLYQGSPAGFTAAINLGAMTAGVAQAYTFVVSLPAAASSSSQGQQVSQPLTWTFNA